MNEQFLLYMCVGGAVTAVAFFVSRIALGERDTRLRQRLTDQQRPQPAATQTAAPVEGGKAWFERLSRAVAEPFMPSTREKQSVIRRGLSYAGIYSASAVRLVTGAKLIFLVAGLGAGYAVGVLIDMVVLGISLGGLVGYFIPKTWLRMQIRSNQRALTVGLPDALDLMVVCVEAGLTVDSAMQRVGQELTLAHPAVGREFGIAHMETRVGLSRGEALKNLGQRTGNASFQSLAAMLIQAERFGTSIAGALRIHADSLRVRRQHAAEEMAAKASVKMSFPLVLCIFPATFIVLAGPTVIGLMKSALFND
jgi:tight adherence protein C